MCTVKANVTPGKKLLPKWTLEEHYWLAMTSLVWEPFLLWCLSSSGSPSHIQPGSRWCSLGISSATNHGIFLFVCFFQTNLIAQRCFKVSAIPLKKSKPVVGFSSLRRRERAGARSQAEQHEHRLHPQKGSGGQRAYWPRWPPAPPVAGPTETTPAHHLHLWRRKDLGTAVLNLWVVDLE